MSFNGDLYPTAGASKVITSKGDLVRGNASGDRERYGIGSTDQVLQVKFRCNPKYLNYFINEDCYR